MSELVLESPLAGIARLGHRVLGLDGQSCTLWESPFIGMLNVRGDAADARFSQAVLAATGLELPVQPNTASLGGGRQLLWLGPDEWLLKLPGAESAAVESALRTGMAGLHCSLVQVGDGNTTLTLQGPASVDLLSCGCPLDLHPRFFGTGALAQTHVAKAGAIVLCLQAGSSFELTVRRSFADYLFRWLCEAGA
ncbi:MAG: sarcosine oxidase subunit gamma [Polaromonas sp.]|nr:sarcosine oxidase subunit gamma [Polaromonas sp.]